MSDPTPFRGWASAAKERPSPGRVDDFNPAAVASCLLAVACPLGAVWTVFFVRPFPSAVTLLVLAMLLGPTAVILGGVALRQLKVAKTQRGRSLALVGIGLGLLDVAASAVFVLLVAEFIYQWAHCTVQCPGS